MLQQRGPCIIRERWDWTSSACFASLYVTMTLLSVKALIPLSGFLLASWRLRLVGWRYSQVLMKQPISLTHLKVSPRLLTRVEGKMGGENQWVQESYSKSCWGNSKRTWLKFSGSDFGLYILLILFVHDCIGSTNTVCIRQTLSPGLWVWKLNRLCIK